jgi:3alpha(or 20beta)-hydroxysteroid dehydrogenase
MTRIDRKVAIITGGTRGQGAATALLFRERGAKVYITDIDVEGGTETAANVGVTFLSHDVTSPQSWSEVLRCVEDEVGRVDVLVNNAGIIQWATMRETTPEMWSRIIAVNQTGPLLGMQTVAPVMIRQRSGSIINISSVGGLGGSSSCFAYGTTKWALRGMSRGAAQELGPYGVRVNVVLPGTIESQMIEGQDREALIRRIPLGRIAKPVEVAYLSLWLASDESSYVSGGEYLVDGASKA